MRFFSPLSSARAHERGEEEDSNFFAPDKKSAGVKDFAVGILGKVQRENAKKVAGVKKSRENSSLNIWETSAVGNDRLLWWGLAGFTVLLATLVMTKCWS